MDLFDAESSSSSGDEEEVSNASIVANAIVREACLHYQVPSRCRVRCVGQGAESVCSKLESSALLVDSEAVDESTSIVAASPESTQFILPSPQWATSTCGGWRIFRRRAAIADSVGCPPRGPADSAEHDRVEACCRNWEDEAGAARTLREQGLVVLPGLYSDGNELGEAALANFEKCRMGLLKNHGVDLEHPQNSTREPTSYRELSMREDCRCDVRLPLEDCVGPSLSRARLVAERIARLAATPEITGEWKAGNFGRYNFDDNGPLAPPRPLKVGEFATVVSLPGAAEQALHADTPHLFDHVQLPGHYFNLFLAPVPTDDAAGQTAFVLGTHRLDACAQVTSDEGAAAGQRGIEQRLVRPRLRQGDALIFDTRILHFGLPNRSNTRRLVVYANIHAHWFHDPKNWDENTSAFEPIDLKEPNS